MYPFPSALLTVPSSSGLPISTQWRLIFPGGANGPSTAVDIREVQMFASDVSTTDLCTGGSASASGGTAANAFDDDTTTTYWTSGSGSAAVNSWLQYTFGSAWEIKSFTMMGHFVGTDFLPTSVKLQYYNGSTWIDRLSYPAPLGMASSKIARFYSDGSIETEYVPSSGGAGSTSAFAAKGTIMDVLKNCTVAYVTVGLNNASESYKAVGVLVDKSTGQITAILGASPTQTTTGAGDYTFTFASPLVLTAGTRFAIIIVRTDGTATSPNHIDFPAVTGDSAAVLTYYGSVRYATLNPAVGDSIVFATSASIVSMSVDIRFTP